MMNSSNFEVRKEFEGTFCTGDTDNKHLQNKVF